MTDEDDTKDGLPPKMTVVKTETVPNNVDSIHKNKPAPTLPLSECADNTEFINNYIATLRLNTRLLNEISAYRFAKYNALRQTGFSEAQAVELCKQVP